MKAKRDDFEFIFISSDQDQESFTSYFGHMPFLAIPFENEKEKDQLSSFFEIEGIPSFIIVDPNGKVITTEARSSVMGDQEGNDFPWYPKPVKNLANPDGINEKPSLVILAEGESKAKKEGFEKILYSVAEKEKARAEAAGEESDILFFIATEDSQVSQKIRSLTKVGKFDSGEGAKEVVCDGDVCHISDSAASNTQIVLLNIADNGSYYVLGGRSAEDVEKFVGDFLSEKLVAKHFGD